MKKLLTILCICFALLPDSNAQTLPTDTLIQPAALTIAYTLNINGGKKEGLAESYNGAMKALFLSQRKARSRMVALMRMQSLFYNSQSAKPYQMVKESGSKRWTQNMDETRWQKLNKQYKGVQYQFTTDTIIIKGYTCQKVILTLSDGKTIMAYYTKQIQHPLFAKLEPAFAGLSGIVLQYSYQNEDALFEYTLSDISFQPIAADIFQKL